MERPTGALEVKTFIHPTVVLGQDVVIGEGVKIWANVHIREYATVGKETIIGEGAYIDHNVRIGERCKIQNGAFVYNPAVLENGVFIGPGARLINDPIPRAINPDGCLKNVADWESKGVKVEEGATVGCGAIVLPGVVVGEWAMVGAGAIVTRDVPSYACVKGNPATATGWVCRCGRPVTKIQILRGAVACDLCVEMADLPGKSFELE
jgi:acetyltransferase-like isoleucine patch superfamily enzyme